MRTIIFKAANIRNALTQENSLVESASFSFFFQDHPKDLPENPTGCNRGLVRKERKLKERHMEGARFRLLPLSSLQPYIWKDLECKIHDGCPTCSNPGWKEAVLQWGSHWCSKKVSRCGVFPCVSPVGYEACVFHMWGRDRDRGRHPGGKTSVMMTAKVFYLHRETRRLRTWGHLGTGKTV